MLHANFLAVNLTGAILIAGCLLLALLFLLSVVAGLFRRRCPTCHRRSIAGGRRIRGKKDEGGDYSFSFCLHCKTGWKRFADGRQESFELGKDSFEG
jgi:hypothetical protein